MKTEWVLRYDRTQRIFRICRFLWRNRKQIPAGSETRDCHFSLALSPRLISWNFGEVDAWFLTFVFLRMHYKKAIVERSNIP